MVRVHTSKELRDMLVIAPHAFKNPEKIWLARLLAGHRDDGALGPSFWMLHCAAGWLNDFLWQHVSDFAGETCLSGAPRPAELDLWPLPSMKDVQMVLRSFSPCSPSTSRLSRDLDSRKAVRLVD